jgi:aminoglycoside phosphotransferase (APT) family kinase protein
MNITQKQASLISKKLNEKLINFSFLAKGNHNDNYLFETDKRKYVLRIESNKMFKNLKKEFALLKSIEKLEISPKVFLLDTSHKIIKTDYLLEEFVIGKNPKKVVEDDFLKLMGKFFKRLHSHKVDSKQNNSSKGYFSILDSIKPYYHNVKKYSSYLDNKSSKEINQLFESIIKLFETEEKTFFKKRKFSILHRDPSRENIFIHKNKIKLIDWEFSERGIPEWEIVYFFQENKLNENQANLFLKSYGYNQTKKNMKLLKILSLLNVSGAVGYSVWRLGLIENNETDENKKQRLNRLKKDIRLMKKLLKELK